MGSTLTCWIPAICRVMYSTETGSSTVSLWLWHSVRALSINTLPSAVKPGQKRVKMRQEYSGEEIGTSRKARLDRQRAERTSKGEADVIVKHDNLADSTRVL